MHLGSSSENGHYQAFKEINGTWYKFNDDKVVEEKNFNNYLKKSSILVYELINNNQLEKKYFKLPYSHEDLKKKNSKFINSNSLKNTSSNNRFKPIPTKNKFTKEEIKAIAEYIIPFVKKYKKSK